jgi:hypothetical protein
MATVTVLYLAHLIADFPLQTNHIFELKAQGNRGILLHVGIHLLVAAVLIQNAYHYWYVLLLLGGMHFVIDWAKLRLPWRRQAPGFILDQFAHVASVLLLAGLWPDAPAVMPLWLMWLGIVMILVPATLMFLWVWATDLQMDLPENDLVKWACRSLLPLSQKVGSVFVIALLVTNILYLV